MTSQNELAFSSLAAGYLLDKALGMADELLDILVGNDAVAGGPTALLLLDNLENLKAIIDLHNKPVQATEAYIDQDGCEWGIPESVCRMEVEDEEP